MNFDFQNLPKKVAIYARVSTEEQADRGTIETQIEFAKKYCELHNISIVKMYQDDGVTGTFPLQNRPSGINLLEDAKKKMFNVVLVYKLDRLGRSTRVILNAVHDLEALDVKLKSMTEPFDTSDPSGRFLLTVLAGVADLDRSNILERMWLGANRAAAKGQWVGGIVPYGYIRNDEKFLEINESPLPNLNMSEADVIRLIYRLCGDEGKTTIDIAAHLNAIHVPTAYVAHGIAAKRRMHVSGKWLSGRILNMLKEPIYKGVHYYGRRASRKRELIKRSFPAIVSEDLWERAQETLKRNQINAMRNANRFYLLRGLIICKNCGLHYHGSPSGTESNHKYSYYVCGTHRRAKGDRMKNCSGKVIRMNWIDDWVWGKCLEYINNPRLVCKAILDNKPLTSHNENEIKMLQQQLKQVTSEKERLVQLYTTGLIDIDEVTGQIESINRNREKLKNRIQEIQDEENNIFSEVETAEEILDLLRKKINSGDLSQEMKHNIVRTLVDHIEVFTNDAGKIEVTVYFAFRETSKTFYEGSETAGRKGVGTKKRDGHNAKILRYSMHEHGFIAAIRIMLEGKVSVACTLETVIFRSSMGSRSTSRVDFPNSGSSSRKRTP